MIAVQAEITDLADISRLVRQTVDAFGSLDHLVTSAGGPPSTTVLETDEQGGLVRS